MQVSGRKVEKKSGWRGVVVPKRFKFEHRLGLIGMGWGGEVDKVDR